ncbi:MAG: hypothetical protein NTW29_14955 [Bacteroidetes bacterium]|nr:hypothetical protein [Bacteroidota bacterium]
MKVIITFLVSCLLIVNCAQSQTNPYTGKSFVNDKLDQIDFINDTVMAASFRAFPEKYEFLKESLVLTLMHHHSDMELRHSYKLLHRSPDTLTFIYTSYEHADTMQFVNIKNRILPITEFDSLRLDSYGWTGSGRIIIRSDRTIKFIEGDWIMPSEQPVAYKQYTLTEEKYKEFIDTLSKSLIFMLPEYRGEGGEDITNTDFYIRANGIDLISKGSCLSKVHSKLVGYLIKTVGKIK